MSSLKRLLKRFNNTAESANHADELKATKEIARDLDRRPLRERIRLNPRTLRRLFYFGLLYAALMLGTLLISGEKPQAGLAALVPAVILLAFLFETMDSATGMGFGTALAPLLLAMGYHPLAVAPALLISEAITGLLAGWMHHEMRNIHFTLKWPPGAEMRILLLITGFGVCSILLSVFITYWALEVPKSAIQLYTAVLVIGMGVIGIARHFLRRSEKYHPLRMAGFAALAGFNKGVGGGGYGPIMTLGQIFSGVFEKNAMAITSLAEGVVSVAGILAFYSITLSGVALDLRLLPSLLAGSILGGVAAPYLVRIVPNRILKYIIPIYALGIGIYALIGLLL